ncbi:MAG: flagellar assembly protein FliH, partial [Thermodesulfatator sp.]
PSIARGGCLLETDFGLVDATLERRWTTLLKALEEAAQGEG